ncbi:MAG: hypothetical protein WAN35_14260, partial [Terracidiphilus sp.]
MNGKSCIYEREIDERLNSRETGRERRAFVVMPFGEKLDVLYQWEIAPFLANGGEKDGESAYRCTPERADDVRQVGFIICEKICKKLQEADYVVVDVTFDNPNVFYEFGLAAALGKTIIPICASEKLTPRKDYLDRRFGIKNVLPYPAFDVLTGRLSGYSWSSHKWSTNNEHLQFEQMSGDPITVLYDSRHKLSGTGRYKDEYDFGALCRSAVGTAVTSIFSANNVSLQPELGFYNEERIFAIKKPRSVDLAIAPLREVVDACKDAACALVDVTNQEAVTNFFWLGYIHGIGGNAIPVNSYRSIEPGISLTTPIDHTTPFDTTALWHVAFREDHPIDLLNSLQQILEYIYVRKARYLNREAFWKNILKDNKVSIFLGSLYLHDLGRNTIGDWDYRTAAEITNFLSTSKETMKVTLESPLPKRETPPDKEYVNWLQSLLHDDTIIVGSADVNDLTEVALAGILGEKPFEEIPETKVSFKGYIAHKCYAEETKKQFPEMAFYLRHLAEKPSRGFMIQDGGAFRLDLMEDHAFPADQQARGVRKLLGQLVVAKNPFAPGKWILIISGISGPATLGIAQMLTGCMYEEFTINSPESISESEKDTVDKCVKRYRELIPAVSPSESDIRRMPYGSLSEQVLERLLKISDKHEGEANAIVQVDVY